MPAVMSYTHVREVVLQPNEVIDSFIYQPTSGVGYHTRPNKSIFIPVLKGQDQFAIEYSCPNIKIGAYYAFDAQAMHCYLSQHEYVLWIEMLAMAAGYASAVFNLPDVGSVSSHMLSVTSKLDDSLPLAPLISYFDQYPCFHGSGLLELSRNLEAIDRRIRQGDLKIAYESWMHRKLQAHIVACERAIETNGLVLLGQ